ncbi:serine hydrolase [Lactobacillus taiwanensis]|uniref:serine hydrolase domain-containing protein n=1 Tax=Lactobacillus taiwanensis TaxID=508451 RepID=UPI000B99AB73|nr:serine hydrolase domain-containing protein [Lactobacillus taiwanensis]MCR1904249.1 beta-lactamase family protein [Lactobacillus taiwanensis]MRM97777.1 class A beta-lactamase-related serine hydrolase [Lactobacillus taiwanensis]OYS00485.1 serine hydrolase [Lactobacillus taiwanensis]OYS03926.1 serine hydrolase [Lactobacillus taiwanensis]
MRLKKIILYIFLAICIFSVCLFVVPSGSRIDPGLKNSQKQLKDYMKSHHINGVMLVSGKDGQPNVIKNNETSNKNDLVNADQLFPTASLQKIITGTAIYQLQQKGQLNWNTPLSKYYPQVSGSQDITIRELMNHTSGLINNARPSEPLKNQEEQIAYMLKYMQNDHLHTWDYQDVDYELLAAIISKESHLSYNDYIQKNFAKPLKLRQIKDYSEVNQNEIPQPMSSNVDWHKVVVTTSSDFGAGNLFISPNDYWKFVYNSVLKDPKMINEYAQQAKHQEVAYFGGVYFKGDVIRAEGSIPGYNACFVANYKTKEMIMLFSNNINYLTLKKASDYLLHHYMGLF